jgi:four helix bundle protein
MYNADRWKNLEAWQLSDKLAHEVYKFTKAFPKEELYGLTSQLRRAALSVPTNIVEGYSRKGYKELSRFIDISLGSLGETTYLLYFSKDLGYIAENDYEALDKIQKELGARLWVFSQRVRGEK